MYLLEYEMLTQQKFFLVNVTVRHVRSMVHRLFGLGDQSFTLKVKYTASGYEQEMDDEMKELQYYALSEDDEIVVITS